jgi:hypothetical protein
MYLVTVAGKTVLAGSIVSTEIDVTVEYTVGSGGVVTIVIVDGG